MTRQGTVSRQAIYTAIVRRWQRTGRGVTYREIAADMGRAFSTVVYCVDRLHHAGLVVRPFGIYRGIRPAVLGEATVAGKDYLVSPVGEW